MSVEQALPFQPSQVAVQGPAVGNQLKPTENIVRFKKAASSCEYRQDL
jgi:hypothetical protein